VTNITPQMLDYQPASLLNTTTNYRQENDMELTAQEIDWVLYSINKTINDNGGMWDNTLTDSIKAKLNNELLLKTGEK
jgi:hypothetical protein